MGVTASWTKVYSGDDYMLSGDVSQYEKRYTFLGSNSYATGGETFPSAADFETTVEIASGHSIADVKFYDNSATYLCVLDDANDKVKFLVAATGVEVANTTDVSSTTMTAVVTVERG